jgi:gamma-glutamyl-gamma-aminobutyrate hydrolase PuuD
MKLLSADWQENDPFGLFDQVEFVSKISDVKDADALILWGGEDIGTEIYNQKANKYVYATKKSARDEREIAMVRQAMQQEIPIIGICRGAQLLCALSGGSLAQHIEGHGNSHAVTLHDEGGTVIRCNSSHHQMMLPPPSAKILATSEATYGIGQYNEAINYERVNEVVYFPNTNGLGIQPHPEWANCPKEFVDYCIRKIKEYIL